MKNLILISAAVGSLSFIGCSSAYRTAQTPDDVYFSEGSPQKEVTRTRAAENQPDGYASYWERQDDDMLRMKVNNRDKWSAVDDIDYWQGYNNNYWVNYNTGFYSPWAMNSWNHPNAWNNPWAWNSFNRPWGWNNGFNSGWGWNVGMGSSFGFNNWGLGFNSWNNCWNNPYAWNRPITVINKYPVGTGRNASALTPYSNYNYNRSNNTMKSRSNVNPGASRSIWDSNPSQSGSSRNSMYRTINRSSNSGGSSYDRPVRTFDGGGSSGGSRSSGGGTSGGSSSGGSSRGGRGG